ncbi:MAG TPA: hypothetical protein VNW06_01920 [Cytophagaceae bacterium]|jgi:hypothetical protein|nr:hypothetical protein [Cytophagaceae bacterium]
MEEILKTSDRQKETQNELVFSYMTLRNLIGFCGMLLPIVLVVFTKEENGLRVQPSISDYYYTNNGDILVAILCILGTFLITYNGYDWKEKVCTITAAVCGLGVAFSPTSSDDKTYASSVHMSHSTVPEIWGIERHLIFAALFFIALSIVSLFFFPKSDKEKSHLDAAGKKTKKGKRNIVYKICGWIMLCCVAVLALHFIIKPKVDTFPFVFIFESIALEAFALSWLTKGETLWPDETHYMVRGYQKIKHVLQKNK